MPESLAPPIRPGESPPFHKIDEYRFQDLCRDIYDTEETVSHCAHYGVRGQRQHGVDLLAPRNNAFEKEVVQCKCYEDFSPSDIRKASKDFLEHAAKWKKEGVKKFVVMVASDVVTTQRHAEIEKQRAKFRRHGIVYELWDAGTIRTKLRPHRAIVQEYLMGSWADLICGAGHSYDSSLRANFERAVTSDLTSSNQLDDLILAVSGVVKQQLQSIRREWRKGNRDKAVKWVEEIRRNPNAWRSLAQPIRAQVLRLQASLELGSQNGIKKAVRLADEALKLDPADDQRRLRCLIARSQHGTDAALNVLDPPRSTDEINLYAGLLLESGKADEAIRQCTKLINAGAENGETYRVRALSNLVSSDIHGARLDAEKAIELDPGYVAPKECIAIVNYHSAIAQGTDVQLGIGPQPIDWGLVLQDDASVARLRRAADIFQELADTHVDQPSELESNQLWRLACLANDASRQAEAEKYLQELVGRDPSKTQAIMWGLTRGYEFDISKSIRSLTGKVRRGTAELEEIMALAGCYLARRNPEKALKIIEDARATFKKRGGVAAWEFWYAQALAATGRTKKALQIIDQSNSPLELSTAREIVLENQFLHSGDSKPLERFLRARYKKTKAPRYLLDLCRLYAQCGEWSEIVSVSDSLVSIVKSEEAIRLACQALHKSNRNEECLNTLEQARSFLKSKKLPNDLRRLKAYCLQSMGHISGAISEVEGLAEEEASTRNLIDLAQVRLMAGDMVGVISVAQQLMADGNLSSSDALRLCEILQSEQPEIAKRLWAFAIESGVPDNLVGNVVSAAFALGLEDEIGPLMQRMAKLAEKGEPGYLSKDLAELTKIRTQQQLEVDELSLKYEKGLAPIHIIADRLRYPLVEMFLRVPASNEKSPDPLHQQHALIRYGGRGIARQEIPESQYWSVNMDLTAILLLDFLGLAETVEKSFKCLKISQTLIPALLQQKNLISTTQISRVEDAKKILAFVDDGKINPISVDSNAIDGLSEFSNDVGPELTYFALKAKETKGYAVAFLPLSNSSLTGPASEPPKGTKKRITNCIRVLRTLRNSGAISNDEFRFGKESLGQEGNKPLGPLIEGWNVPLFLSTNVCGLLLKTDLLDIACQKFDVRISDEEIVSLRTEIEDHRSRKWMARKISGIVRRINDGQRRGTYAILPAVASPSKAFQDLMEEDKLQTACLHSLIALPHQDQEMVWFDDRCINSYQNISNIPIVDIIDILNILRQRNRLNHQEYYGTLSRLRSANFRFIPIERDELIYHLNQAREVDGKIVETRNLSIIRKYLNACIVQSGDMELPPMPARHRNPNGEAPFFVGMINVVRETIASLWCDQKMATERMAACSTWLADSAMIDIAALRLVTGMQRKNEDVRALVAASLSALISVSIQIVSSAPNSGIEKCVEFLNWLNNKILSDSLLMNSGLIDLIAADLRQSLIGIVDRDHLPQPQRNILKALVIKVVDSLPEELKDKVWEHTEFAAEFSVTVHSVTSFGGLSVDAQSMWSAAAEIVSGKRQRTVRSIDGSQKLVLRPSRIDGEKLSIDLFVKGGSENWVLADDTLGALYDSPTARENILKKNRKWFDCEQSVFENVVSDIVSSPNAADRMSIVNEWRSESLDWFYEQLLESLEKEQKFPIDKLLPPNPNGFLGHFRMKRTVGAGNFYDSIEKSAKSIQEELGTRSAIDRYATLPVPFPETIFIHLRDSSETERRQIVKLWLAASGSPMYWVHLLYVLNRLGQHFPKYVRLARRLVAKLDVESAIHNFRALKAIVSWHVNETYVHQRSSEWAAEIRLLVSWYHAHNIFTVFRRVNATTDWIIEYFTDVARRTPIELFRNRSSGWMDISHPTNLSPEEMTICGIRYALSEASEPIIQQVGETNISDLASMTVDGQKGPSIHMMSDPKLRTDLLDSFFGVGRDTVFSSFLSKELYQPYESKNLRSLVIDNLEKIIEGQNQLVGWVVVGAVIGNAKPYHGTKKQILEAISATNFAYYFEQDSWAALVSFKAAVDLPVLANEKSIRTIVEDQLMKICRSLNVGNDVTSISDANDDSKTEVSETSCAGILIEIAWCIARQQNTSTKIESQFVALLTRMIQTEPKLAKYARPLIRHLCRRMPISDALNFWPLLVTLRAI